MNKSLPWTRINNKLTVVLPNGQPKTISDDKKELFDEVIRCIKDGLWDLIPDLLDTKAAIFNFSNGQFEVINNVVHVQGKPVPNGLSKKIIAFAQEGLPFQPLLNFWNKLSRNISYRNVQGLFDFLEINNYPITEDGDFIAYKKIKDDWTDCRTGKIFNNVGTVISMPRNEVNDNPEQTCAEGFHCANWEFSWGFDHGKMIMVSVNPEHVVSMPTAYDFTKMRICQYTVLSEVVKEEKGNLYKTPVDSSEKNEYANCYGECETCSCDDLEDEFCDCDNYNCVEYDSHHQSCNCSVDDSSCKIF